MNYLQTYRIFESNNTNLGILSDYINSVIKIEDDTKQKKDDLDKKYKSIFIKYIKSCLHKFGDLTFKNPGFEHSRHITRLLRISEVKNDKIIVKFKLNPNSLKYQGKLIKTGVFSSSFYNFINLNNLDTDDLSYIVKKIMESDFMESYTMNILKKINETKSTPSEILDNFNDRIKSIDVDDNFKINVVRTKGSYKVVAIDKNTNKSVGRIYIQEIKKKEDGGYTAQLRRFHVSDGYRNTEIAKKLGRIAIDTFGDIDLYAIASPNRIEGMDDSNIEQYRKKLKRFYRFAGFNPVGTGHRVERPSNVIK